MSAVFAHEAVRPVAKNRFSRRFVLVQNGVSLCMLQNEFLFKKVVIYTRFWAICS